ncbi:MAG: PD-(D/E)XK nuclease family protein [Schaalia odontolytica]
MSEIKVRLRSRDADWWRLPELNPEQSAVVEAARSGDVIARGAPGSGRSTCALAVFERAAAQGRSALILAPDRARVDVLTPLGPDTVRPVRTPASFAYQVVATWRTQRDVPLEGVELVTGAAQDQMLAEALESVDAPWPQDIGEQMRAMPAFRSELRNLVARAGEAGMDAAALSEAGARFGCPQWQGAGAIVAALEEGPQHCPEYPQTLRVDLSRIQSLAADLIDAWEEDAPSHGVQASRPVPDVVIVDDLQDCTPSTLTLLRACRDAGARIVALSDSDVAVAGYRGGEPHLDRRLASALDIEIEELGQVYDTSRAVRELEQQACARIAQSGSPARREASVADDAPAGQLVTHLGATPSQMGAMIARAIRSHHLHDGIAFSDQVVIVRSSSMVVETRRYLERGGVPVAGGGRAFDFATQPTTRLLLDLVTMPVGDSDTDVAARRELAERLLPSALVGADALAVHRLLRRLNAARAQAAEDAGGEAAQVPLTSADLVDDPETWKPTLEQAQQAGGKRARAAALLAGPLETAARLWELGMSGSARPQERLWSLWEACGVAGDWRSRAIASDESSAWYDDQLDAVVALLRVADVWEQRNPAGSAVRFASELLSGSVPIDTISRVGVRPSGVEVLTPAQAMGRRWQVVVLVGLQDGAWPNLRLRDRILRADLLADVGAGRTVVGEDGREELIDSTRSARRAVLDDEYRLFVAALSRSCCIVHAGAVRSEDAAPSVFFDMVARLAGTPRENDVVPIDQVDAPLSLSGHIADLRARAASPDDPVDAELAATLLAFMAREGIASAQPERWLGAGGTPTSAQDYRGQIVLSPSQFERALACPLRWFLTTIGADAPSNAAASLGTLVHAVAEEHPHGTPEELTAALETRIEELGYNLDTWAGRVADRHARDIVNNLASYVVGVPGDVTVEQTVSAEVEGVTIRGRMDRLEQVDEGVRVTDLKTGKSGYTKASVTENPQLAAYQMALLASGEKVAGARIALLGGSKPQIFDQPALAGEELERWREWVREVALGARGPYFEARPSAEACRYCSFDRLCPARERGRKVVE